MKYWKLMIAGLIALTLCIAVPALTMAGSVEKIKDDTKEAVSDAKKEAIQTGRAAVETGKGIKKEAVKTGIAIKEGVKEVGREFKKAYQETRDAVKKEVSGDTRESSDR
jgi:hypothetical protein